MDSWEDDQTQVDLGVSSFWANKYRRTEERFDGAQKMWGLRVCLRIGGPSQSGLFLYQNWPWNDVFERSEQFLMTYYTTSRFKKQEPFPLNNRRQEPSPKKTGTFLSGCPLLVPFPGVPAIPAINAAEEDIAFLKGKTCPWDEDLPPRGIRCKSHPSQNSRSRMNFCKWRSCFSTRSCFWIFFAFQAF